MGDLPAERVRPAKPFLNTGVDYCGPFFIKEKHHRNAAPRKVYVASFVCFSIKAIHLEIVRDMTTESFLACLKRFIYRRGKVETIWSDNAKTFVGAKNELHELYEMFQSESELSTITKYCVSESINWKFIPPRAPNFGGLWEASVKSFKTHLKRATKGAI